MHTLLMKMQLCKLFYMIRIFLFVLLLFYSCQPNKAQNQTITDESTEHQKKEVVVFVYHRFGDNTYPSTNISLENFELHLSYLKNTGFEVITFGEAVDYITDTQISYKEKVACITVDDGYKSFYKNGLPLIQKYGFTATVFINSESVGGGMYMNWEELANIHEKGIEIGNHSDSHAYFLNIPENERINEFKQDVLRCQKEIEEHLGFTPDIFAYPYGEFDLEMKSALKAMGFKAAAAQNSGVMHAYDPYAIPRFPMAGPYVKLEGFKEKANMKALRIKEKSPESFVLTGQNPPTLQIIFDTTSVDLDRYNCFISPGCKSNLSNNKMVISAEKPLQNRRTLFTITAPSKTGNRWHWFSHLWIRPEVSE